MRSCEPLPPLMVSASLEAPEPGSTQPVRSLRYAARGGAAYPVTIGNGTAQVLTELQEDLVAA